MEEVLLDLYNRAQTKGYKKSMEDFTSLLYTNDNVLQDMYGYVQSKGYNKPIDDFEKLIGKKKIEILPTPQPPTGLDLEDGLSVSADEIKGEEQTFFDELLPNTEIADFMGDMLMNVKQGLAQGASINDALKVMRQGSDASDEDIQNYIDAVSKMQSMPMTDEMRDFARIYEGDENKFRGFIKGLAANPSVIPGIVAQSVSNMANLSTLFGGVKGVGAGATAGSVVPILGTAAGAVYGGIAGLTNTLEKGLSFTEFLQEEIDRKGLKFDNEGIKAVLDDPDALSRVKRRTVARGATISTVNALTAGIAGQTARAARQLTKLPKTAARAARTTTEMVGGGLGEAAGRAVAGQEMDVAEIGFEALGELGAPETLFSLTPTRKPTGDVQSSVKIASYKINNEPVNKSDIEDILNSGDLEAISKITYEITNDPDLANKIEQARADAIVANDIKKAFPAGTVIDDADLNNLVTLQKELTSLRDNPTEIAKDRIPEIELQIKNIKDAIQKPSPEKVDVQEPAPDSEAVGEGDIQQQPVTREVTPEQVEAEAKPTEEIEAEVEVTPSEVETYTLPENPIEAKKDFEIIDNRNQKAGLEIDEDGNGKYYVENIKTGKIVAVKTKKEAQETIRNPKSFDYGEGQPVLEEFKTQVTEEVVESPIEAAPTDKVRQIGNFEVIIAEDNVIKSIKKNGKEVSDQGRRNAEKQIIQAGEIDVTKGKKAQLDEGMSPTEVSEVILKESTNPSEIAQEIQLIKEKKKNKKRALQVGKESGLPSLFGTKFTPESIIDVFRVKPSELGEGFTRTWVSKTGKNLEDGFIDPNRVEFDKDQVADFIRENPSEAKYNREFLNKLPQLQKDLENKFEELTGIIPTEGNIKLASSPEKIAEVAEKAIFEAERKAEEKPIVEAEPKKYIPPKEKKLDITNDVKESVENMKPAIDRITLNGIKFGLDNIASQVKAFVTSRENVLLQKARSTPTQYIDQSLGINNSTVIADNTFTTLAEAEAQLYGQFNKVLDEVSEAQSFVDFDGQKKLQRKLGISRLRNKSMKDILEIGLYMQVREADANKIGDEFNNDIAPDPVEMLKFTIDKMPAPEAKALQELYDKYVKDGKINKDEIFNNFSNGQKKAFEIVDKKNKELLPKIKEISDRTGRSFTPINEYVHRVVFQSKDRDRVNILDKAEKYSNLSTRGRVTFERTPGAKPIDYNPFNSVLLGTQETLLDYYMSPAADKVQSVTEELKKEYSKGNDGQKQAVKALDESVKEILELSYLRSFMGARNINAGKKIQNEIEKNAYRAMLSSGTRMFSEYLGNTLMLISQDPNVIADTYTKYKKLSKDPETFRDVLLSLGSAEIRKLTDKKTISNKNIDVNNYLNLGQSRERMISNPVFQKMDQISKYGPKQLYKGVSKLADELMSFGDKAIARPLWPAKFANEFKKNVKKQLGEDINITMDEFEKIAKGTSKFVLDNKYKKARLDAVRKSDRTLSQFVTSGNPMYRIIKNIQTRKGEGVLNLMDYYRMLNSYMANFNLNEYASSRFAIGALFKSGYMSKREAIALQAGILARMSSYVAAYTLVNQFMDQLLGAPEEEKEDDLKNLLKRQLLGSAATLTFRGGIGNIWALPINFGIESLNEKYLENLRNGAPYDAYDNSIVYSLISLDDFGEKKTTEIILPILAGRYGPFAKTLFRGGDLTARMLNAKTLEAREKAAEELLNRIVSFEFLGLLGIIPFYKDWRRINLKKRFSDSNASGGSVRR